MKSRRSSTRRYNHERSAERGKCSYAKNELICVPHAAIAYGNNRQGEAHCEKSTKASTTSIVLASSVSFLDHRPTRQMGAEIERPERVLNWRNNCSLLSRFLRLHVTSFVNTKIALISALGEDSCRDDNIRTSAAAVPACGEPFLLNRAAAMLLLRLIHNFYLFIWAYKSKPSS